MAASTAPEWNIEPGLEPMTSRSGAWVVYCGKPYDKDVNLVAVCDSKDLARQVAREHNAHDNLVIALDDIRLRGMPGQWEQRRAIEALDELNNQGKEADDDQTA